MKFVLDTSELAGLSRHLINVAPVQASGAAHAVTIAESTRVQARAKAAAPKDRPWLASRGIRRKSGKDARGSWSIVYTTPDPRGRAVGFYVEYGTSRMAAQPFMTPAVQPTHQTYPAALAAAISPLSGGTGGGAPTGSGDDG